jgi:DNA-binding XRE family transcriptional regulator
MPGNGRNKGGVPMMQLIFHRAAAGLLLLASGLVVSGLTVLLLLLFATTANAQSLSGTNVDRGLSRQTAAHVIGLTEEALTQIENRLTELEDELTVLETEAEALERAIENLTPRSCAANQKITWSGAYGCDVDRTL